jgi:hypothetical protein
MRIIEVTYRENRLGADVGKPGSNYKTRTIEAKACLNKGEKPDVAVQQLKQWVQDQLGIKPEISSDEEAMLKCLASDCEGRLYAGKPSSMQRKLSSQGLIALTFKCGTGTFQVQITDKGKEVIGQAFTPNGAY